MHAMWEIRRETDMDLYTEVVNSIIPIIITALLSVTITLFIQAILRPNPLSGLDHWVRKHFKAGKLRIDSLTLSGNYKLTNPMDFDQFESVTGLQRATLSTNFKTEISKKAAAKLESIAEDSPYLFRFSFELKELSGVLEISLLGNAEGIEIGDSVSVIDLMIKVPHYNYKNIHRVLVDMFMILTKVNEYFSQLFGNSVTLPIENSFAIKVKKPTVLSQYLRKLSAKLVYANTDGVKISIGKNDMSIKGRIDSSMFEEIGDIVLWYI